MSNPPLQIKHNINNINTLPKDITVVGRIGNMSQTKIVSVNGRQYDPLSGLPIGDDAPKETEATIVTPPTHAIHSIHAGNVHSLAQKSKTLRRASLKRPVAAPAPMQHTIQYNKRPTVTVQQTVAKSPQVTKFAPRPVQAPRIMDIGPARHPHVVKAQARIDAKAAPTIVKPSQVLKQEAIKEAVANTTKQTKQYKRGFRHPGALSIITAAFALVILGGYLTYLNMPSLSVRVAAVAAGVNASYPDYRPDGYRLNGPVAYDQGQVSMKFVANAGPQNFTIKQAKSSWDSAAVLDNYVKPKVGNDYATYSERGLTIYTFDGGVAWVNGGILYTIDGNAPLSGEQIRHIATSFI
jgi:hypothetical protein